MTGWRLRPRAPSEAVRQAADEPVCVGELCRRYTLLIGGVQPAIADVFEHRAGKQAGVLQHHAETAAQVGLFNPADVDAVVANLPLLNVVKPVDQVGDRRLAGAGGADERNFLPRFCIHADVVQHRFWSVISERDVLKGHLSAQPHIGGAAFGSWLLPGPKAGLLGRFHERALRTFPDVDQLGIAAVLLWRFIQQRKGARGARGRHDDAADLLAEH